MLSVRYNNCITLWRNKKKSWKDKKNEHYIDKYNWEKINNPSEKDDSENLRK